MVWNPDHLGGLSGGSWSTGPEDEGVPDPEYTVEDVFAVLKTVSSTNRLPASAENERTNVNTMVLARSRAKRNGLEGT